MKDLIATANPRNLKYDLPAGLAVFLVAIPLCLGIAHASGAPLLSGLISGVIGGILIGTLSQSQLSVSGPAAGLTAIVIAGIADIGSFEGFLVAVFIAGILQLVLGLLKVGKVVSFLPSSVINGMLSAIGVILIIKQFPHMIGYDIEQMGVEEFKLRATDIVKSPEDLDNQNTFSVLMKAFKNINEAVLIIGLSSFCIMIIWDKFIQPKLRVVPGALIVVLFGVTAAYFARITYPNDMTVNHFVNVPGITTITEFLHATSLPDWKFLGSYQVYIVAITIAIVASVETLLSIEAMDKIDPEKRVSPPNRELLAQGIGNAVCGLIGGIPVTAVIVRGSVNVAAGGKSQWSAIIHGIFILISVAYLSQVLNNIPLASLAAILVYTGYKLVKPQSVIALYKKSHSQFLIFMITLTCIVVTDLLIGVIIGLAFSFVIIAYENYRSKVLQVTVSGKRKRIILGENVTFLHKPKIWTELNDTPTNWTIEIDASKSLYIDEEVRDLLAEFRLQAVSKNIEYIIGGIKSMSRDEKQIAEANERYQMLFKNNRKWVDEMLENDPEFFSRLSKGQSPDFLFIGCSDSRVPADKITGVEQGQMFVHRNIANLVVNTDINLMSVLQFSVEVLNVKHVMVCGHYGCGGVKAALDDSPHGLIDKWLRNIKDVYRLHKDEIDGIEDSNLKQRRLVELNVREQVYNLYKTSFIQRNRSLYGFPQLHGLVYDINDGLLVDLNIDIEKDFPNFNDIYKMY